MEYNLLILCMLMIILSSTKTQVYAQQRPKIVEHPADAIAAIEEPLTLNCKATGRPIPEISWYHNGTPLVLSERRVILPEGSLFFLRVMQKKRGEKDAGIYWCEAKSSAGIAVSKNATLQIAFIKDDFRSVPKDTVALFGGPVIMNCTPPRGLPEPSVLWYKDGKLLDLGKRISMIEEGSIMISEVQSSDAGRYECSAQNMAGSKSAPAAILKVLTPPMLVRGPQDTEVIEGEGLDIPCEIKGDPKPIVSWYRESGQLPEGRSRTLLDYTLRIEDARAEDQGQYTCKGFNEGGNVSVSIRLSVYATPQFIEAPSDADAQIGETVKLPCRASGRPKTVIIWDKITSSESIKLKENYSQMLREEKQHQEILAKAKIMSFRPPKKRRSVLLPSEEDDDKNDDLLDDEIDNLFSELPATSNNIDFTSSPLPPSSPPDLPHYEVGENGDLILLDVQKIDEGWYACTAINEAGSVSKKIYLHVKDTTETTDNEFVIPDPPGSRWGSPQTMLITTITPHSFNTLDVSWAVTQPNLFTGKSITIYYRPVISKAHNYACVLSKEYLSATTSVDNKAHRLKDLKPFTIYEIFATVPKGLGGSISNLRKGKTLDGAPSAPPTDVRVGVINNTAAYVRWSPPPLDEINGELTGYRIQIKSNVTNKLLGQMQLNATTQSVVINSLSPGGRYIARVAPLTAGGMGPFSPPAALHMDPSFIARPPKTDPTMTSWKGSWMPGIALAILGICLISGAIFAVFWAKRNKRNLKAAYPAANSNLLTNTNLPDKSFNTLWMNDNVTIKPTHLSSLPPLPSEYAEVTHVNYPPPKLPQNPPPEPYATVTLQRGISGMMTTHSDDKNNSSKFSLSQSSSDNNAPIRIPMNICDMLPPPPDHPYDSYHKPHMNNMTIRTNPAALSPQILRKGVNCVGGAGINQQQQSPMQQQQTPSMWGTLPAIPPAPPIPNFPQNWQQQQRHLQQQQQQNHLHQNGGLNGPITMYNQQQQQHHHHHHPNFVVGQSNNLVYPTENDYESGSILYEQFCRDNEASYFTGSGEPTEEYYRNVNMEFFEDQDFEPSTPPPPCPPDSSYNKVGNNSNLRLLVNTKNNNINGGGNVGGGQPQQQQQQQQENFLSQKRMFRNASQHHNSRDSSCDRNNTRTASSDDSESDVNDSRWVTRSRRSRSRSKSNERRFREQ